MSIELTEDARLSLPRELVVGRIVMIAFLSALLLREVASFDHIAGAEQVWLVVLLLAFSLGWIWFWWSLAAGPSSVALAGAVTLIVVAATALVLVNPIGVFPFYYAVAAVGAAYPWRLGIPLVATTWLLAGVTWEIAGGGGPWEVLLITALFGGGAITVRRYVASQVALIQSQDELRRLATDQARAELARDLHDQLGQELTVGVLQAELLAQDLSDASPVLRDRAALVVSSSRSALQLMRDTVSDTRTPNLATELSSARSLLTATGVSCHVDVRCDVDSLEARTVLGWVVREAVTNVLRHSGARRCTITVEESEESIVMTVSDDGEGRVASEPGSGLANMEHRLSALGGTLVAEQAPQGGFRLIAQIPVAG